MREFGEFSKLILTNPSGWFRMQMAWICSNLLLIVLGLIFWGFVLVYKA